MEMIALFGAAFAGAVFMIIYAPFSLFVPFVKTKKGKEQQRGFVMLRRPSFILGALTLASWYFAFVLNFIPEYDLSTLLLVYGGVLILAVVISLLGELRYRKA